MNKYVKEVIANFDFEKVHKAMYALKWTWWNSKSDDGVPSTSELVMHATDMLNRAYKADHDTYKIACGGFVAHKEDNVIALSFEIDSWDVRMEDSYND
jgi:hypothetical protein